MFNKKKKERCLQVEPVLCFIVKGFCVVFLSILFSVLGLNTFSSYKYINDNYAITKKKKAWSFFYVAELNLKLKQSILDVFVCSCSTLRMCSSVTYRNYHGYNILKW